MARSKRVFSALLLAMALVAVPLHAQSGKSIIIRMIDVKTGRMVATSDYIVQVDHKRDAHSDWVTQEEGGEGKLTLPADVSQIQIRGKYDNSMEIYINCDTENERKAARYSDVPDHWYPVADILAKGLVATDECKSKETAKHDYVAKPGEFIFFVRRQNWIEVGKN